MSDVFLIHFWTAAVASLVSCTCALLGTFLVLRRTSLLGDAISHSILPGLALAFLITGTRNVGFMFIGATLCGLLTAFLSQFLSKQCKVDQGAALGVVFTSLFALGVILIRFAADRVDLDPGCVLYGLLEYTALDTTSFLGIEVPRAFLILITAFIVCSVFVYFLWKELQLILFDPLLATCLGFSSSLLLFAFMGLVAAVSVAAFESVGSIIVVAMLIIPGASARLLTDRYHLTLFIALGLAFISALGGYALSVYFNSSAAGMIAVVSGALFFITAFFAPRFGILSRLFDSMQIAFRILREDILGIVFRCQEAGNPKSFPLSQRNILAALGASFGGILALGHLKRKGLLAVSNEGIYKLTAAGEATAKDLVRTHRLWETYLVEHLALGSDHVHTTAATLEHFTPQELSTSLAEAVGDRKLDPHGKDLFPKDKSSNDND